ncbi:MAG: hypothetical protein L6W00_05850 [Lentisphaeria bacterium]|nr:MAG: hypothetical protein L6W00_05850 [Lentisphaeria bacterium]
MNHLIGRIFSPYLDVSASGLLAQADCTLLRFLHLFRGAGAAGGEQKLTGVPVEIRLPPELISVGRQDFLVSVTARGPKSSLRNFEGRDLKGVVEVRLEDYVPGVPFKVRLHPSDFRPVKGCQRQFDRSAVWGAGAESAAEGVTECSDTTEIHRAAGAELPACRCALHSL